MQDCFSSTTHSWISRAVYKFGILFITKCGQNKIRKIFVRLNYVVDIKCMYDSFDFFRINSEPISDVFFSSFPISIITLIVRLNADSIDLHK